ncbi:GAS2 domain protein [Aspergillus lucknowensis]|uniref:GAR domain-containing protein n=1 Tax=Aspergillus lucknowensis TaxID=176173 RepID=A0ABR4M437_9EURO
MASSRLSPPRRPFQLHPPTLLPKVSDRLAVPHYHVSDPLLGKLSPESTLEALSSTDAVPKNEKVAHDILSRSISQASPTERALGIRAAVAAQKLGQWYREVQKWEWPKRTDAHLGKGFIPPSDAEPAYCGSLPASVVSEREKRVEEIRDGMDSLDVEELKEHVLNAHIPGRSRPSSAHSTISLPPPLSYVQLSDFTAVITATILRALPLLSRLNSLLSTWSVRLLVLRQIPGLLQSLQFARSELNSAMALLESSEPPTENDVLYSIANYHAKRLVLESTVVSTGRRMDRILDSLDGREDSLPERWIDDLEAIEADFASWVMQAERRTVENEWRRLSPRPRENDKHETKIVEPHLQNTEEAKEILADTPSAEASITNSPDTADTTHEPASQTRLAPVQLGRTHPMETIVEEIGSPLEPSTQPNVSEIDDFCAVATQITLPESPSPLPSDAVNMQEPLGRIPATQLDVDCDFDASVDGTRAVPQDDHITLPQSPVDFLVDEPTHPPQTPEGTIRALNFSHEELQSSKPIQPEENVSKDTEPSEEPDQSTSLPDVEPARLEPVKPDFEASSETPEEPPIQIQASLPEQAGTRIPPSPEDPPKSALPLQNNCPPPADTQPSESSADLESLAKFVKSPQPVLMDDYQHSTTNGAAVGSVPQEARTPTSSERCGTSLNTAVAALPNLFIPLDNGKAYTEQRQSEEPENEEKITPKKPLDSPIKLSKNRPGRLDLDKPNSKPRAHRASHGSDGSLSDYPSLVSSPEIPEPRTSSTNGTPLLLETPPNFPTDYRPAGLVQRNNDHTLREDRLLHLEAQKPSPREAFAHNRALSLPLQRFINERLEMNYDSGSSPEVTSAESSDYGKKEPITRRPKSKSTTSPADTRRVDRQKLASTREESSGPDSDTSSGPQRVVNGNTAHDLRQAEPLNSMTTARLRKRLTAHPSLESIGPYKTNSGPADEPSAGASLDSTKVRSSSPTKQLIRPQDQMDEKINSILTSLPGHIHLVPADQDDDAMSVASSLPLRRERIRSHSPQGTPTRSITPTPSLILRPAVSRRRHSHAPEESSVKLYHLHRGGKSAPTKLFVRTVGENGERVMVRVGGGWADLAEYLREYAIHHGRRHVSETPRVEVEGISSRESPSYSPPGSRVPSGSGRPVPARPRSVLSNRPASSLAVRKTRRSSNVSDMADFRTVSAGEALNVSFSPMSSVLPSRRLSVSSNVSAGAISSVSEFRHGSPSTGAASPAMPLGLAGPKPRAKHATISPESEAWVEDVLGQARRSSSLRPFKFGPLIPDNEPEANTPKLPKSRSISDIGKAGSSKRVVLRGLR